MFSIVFAYIASVVGAGFASGQETVSFFVRYGRAGAVGIIVSAVIFGMFAAAVLKICVRDGISSYDEFLRHVFPGPAAAFMKALTIVFAYVSFCAMAAAGGAMSRGLFGISPIWGCAVVCVLAALILVSGSERAMKYNALLGGIIAVGIISCCLYIAGYREHQTFARVSRAVVSSVCYAGYNLITSGAVIVNMSGRIKTERDASLTGFAAGFTAAVIMLLMWAVLSIYYGKTDLGEMPMLTMAVRQNAPTAVIYAALLFMAVLTTAVASGEAARGALGRLTLPLMIVCAVSFASAGFVNFVNIAYRICGFAGIFPPFYIIIKNAKNGAKVRKQKKIKDNGTKCE